MPQASGILLTSALAFLFAGSVGHAESTKLQPDLAAVSFLVGDWSDGKGQVTDTGGTSTGSSHISPAANGGALLRQDRTQLFDKAGHPTGSFDQIMLIYPEGGQLHADYSDGVHVIHYTSAQIEPGRSLVLMTADATNAPSYRLSYRFTAPDTLSITFALRAPGSPDFHAIATGTMTKRR